MSGFWRTCDGSEGGSDEEALSEDADEVVRAAAVEEEDVTVHTAALKPLVLPLTLHSKDRLYVTTYNTKKHHVTGNTTASNQSNS